MKSNLHGFLTQENMELTLQEANKEVGYHKGFNVHIYEVGYRLDPVLHFDYLCFQIPIQALAVIQTLPPGKWENQLALHLKQLLQQSPILLVSFCVVILKKNMASVTRKGTFGHYK